MVKRGRVHLAVLALLAACGPDSVGRSDMDLIGAGDANPADAMEYQADYAYEIELRIAQCMREQGFTYNAIRPEPPADIDIMFNDMRLRTAADVEERGYGVVDAVWESLFGPPAGNDTPTSTEVQTAIPLDEVSADYLAALGANDPPSGCAHRATAAVERSDLPSPESLSAEYSARILGHPNVLDAERRWARCLGGAAGIDVRNLGSGLTAVEEALSAVIAQKASEQWSEDRYRRELRRVKVTEREIAVRDVECRAGYHRAIEAAEKEAGYR